MSSCRSLMRPLALLPALIIFPAWGIIDPPQSLAQTTFISALGWEDDVDPVVAPDGEFMVLCEETQNGGSARVRILDLDAALGTAIGVTLSRIVPGFENGVDPLVLPQLEVGAGYPVLVPCESEDGASAGILVLLVDEDGALLDEQWINLGNLGFRPDVDGLWTHYLMPAIAFFALESEDHSVRGVIAIDADPRAGVGAGLFGGCTLLATAPVAACGPAIIVPWLTGLADAVDPVAYEKIACCARLALPVVSRLGTDADIMLIDFDPNFEPPVYEGFTSVLTRNSVGDRPTAFPGFERDVDMKLLNGECGFASPHILVPVEGPMDVADLYLLDQDGNAVWTYSHDSGATAAQAITGFEAGVDPVLICDAPGKDPRIALPVENAAGTDADLYLVGLSDGHLLARVEDPVFNPGLTIAGYEIGVDPALWTSDLLVLPVEGPATAPGLICVNVDGIVQSSSFGGIVLGFRRSVGILVDARGASPILWVPVGKDDGSDSNVLIGNTPPMLGGTTLEIANPGEVMADYQWDVDMGLVDKTRPGGAFLYLPEENATGARLRVQEVPTAARLAVATRSVMALPSSLYFVGTAPLGGIIAEYTDCLGLETGLDILDGRGEVSQDWAPNRMKTPGQDGDGDPTLAWLLEATSDVGQGAVTPQLLLGHPNPVRFPVSIRVSMPVSTSAELEIFDAAGRRIRRLGVEVAAGGDRMVRWDGRDDRGAGVSSGVYWIRLRSGSGTTASRMIVVH